jgi:hypothetical protein
LDTEVQLPLASKSYYFVGFPSKFALTMSTENANTEVVDPATNEEVGEVVQNVVDIQIVLPNDITVEMRNVFIGENVGALKLALMDYYESCHYSSYELHLIKTVSSEGVESASDVQVNDISELATLFPPETTSCVFALVTTEYDIKKVRDQLKRINMLIQNPPTVRGSSVGPGASKSAQVATVKAAKGLPKIEEVLQHNEFGQFFGEVLFRTADFSAVQLQSNKAVVESIKSVFTSGWNPPPPPRKLKGDLLYLEVITANEGTFYITAVARYVIFMLSLECLSRICANVLCCVILFCPCLSGFYVSKSNRGHFDPSPAANHHFSHELLTLLLSASATFRAAWAAACPVTPTSAPAAPAAEGSEEEKAAAAADAPAAEVSAMDLMAWMYAQGRGAQQSAEAASVITQAQWNAYNMDAYNAFLATSAGTGSASSAAVEPAPSSAHSYNLFRTQQELSNMHGVEELGAPRDWYVYSPLLSSPLSMHSCCAWLLPM